MRRLALALALSIAIPACTGDSQAAWAKIINLGARCFQGITSGSSSSSSSAPSSSP